MRRLARNARVDFMQTHLLLARAVQAGLSEEDATAVQAIANGGGGEHIYASVGRTD